MVGMSIEMVRKYSRRIDRRLAARGTGAERPDAKIRLPVKNETREKPMDAGIFEVPALTRHYPCRARLRLGLR